MVPQEVTDYCVGKKEEAIQKQYDRERVFATYAQVYPELANEYIQRMAGALPIDPLTLLKEYTS